MRGRESPQNIYDRLNATFFNGRLPRFMVRRDFKAGAPTFCDVQNHRIHLPVDLDPKEIEQAIVHEMVHIVTGGGHDDAFRSELKRLAKLGCLSAFAELKLEEWHEVSARAAETIASEHRQMNLADLIKCVEARVGPAPDKETVGSMRVLTAWQTVRRAGGEGARRDVKKPRAVL